MDHKNKKKKKSRFKVEIKEGPAHGGLYELEIDTIFNVIDIKKKKTIMTFSGEYSASLGDHGWDDGYYTGITRVEITDDDKYILVYEEGKKDPEKIPLPDD